MHDGARRWYTNNVVIQRCVAEKRVINCYDNNIIIRHLPIRRLPNILIIRFSQTSYAFAHKILISNNLFRNEHFGYDSFILFRSAATAIAGVVQLYD